MRIIQQKLQTIFKRNFVNTTTKINFKSSKKKK